MKTISRLFIITLSAGTLMTLFTPQASAGCGDVSNLQGPFVFPQTGFDSSLIAPMGKEARSNTQGGADAAIVGLWKVQFISKGNTSHNPYIPDGALLDFGYTQWHSDGTEILNSGGHSPASGNFCLGVWAKTGYLTFEVNHFPIGYNAATGTLTNYINLREQVTLSPSGDSYTGTFTMLIYDTMGNQVDHLTGTIAATRLTVDSTLPGAAPRELTAYTAPGQGPITGTPARRPLSLKCSPFAKLLKGVIHV